MILLRHNSSSLNERNHCDRDVFGYPILVQIFTIFFLRFHLSFSFYGGDYQTLKTVFGHISKHLKVRQKHSVVTDSDRQCFIGISNTEKRVENTTRSGVLLSKFEVFG